MVITRFAPSPTNPKGEGLHVGGLRTALYNYVLAKKNGGKFVLRIEDTDVDRSNEQCLRSILADLKWAGIEPDAGFKVDDRGQLAQYNNTDIDFGPLKQSQRKAIYDKYIDQLMQGNMAYEKDGAIFFTMPKETVAFRDEILGILKLPASDCQDFVIRKSSGMPSFYFAMTCDDHEMGITHVIRGQEHVNTAYRQIALCKALGFKTPSFGHIPLIMNADGSKMSKRQTEGQVNTNDFRKDGYIAPALVNYLALLGWNPGNNLEEFDINLMLEKFDVRDIGKSNARFDYKKLANFNSSYLSKLTLDQFSEQFADYAKDFYPEFWLKLDGSGLTTKVLSAYYKRAKTFQDIINGSGFFFDDVNYNQDALDKVMKKGGFDVLRSLVDGLSSLEWSVENLNKWIVDTSKERNLSMNKIAQPLRVAVTGSTVSPPIDVTLNTIGKSKAMSRINDCLSLQEEVLV